MGIGMIDSSFIPNVPTKYHCIKTINGAENPFKPIACNPSWMLNSNTDKMKFISVLPNKGSRLLMIPMIKPMIAIVMSDISNFNRP